MPVPLIVKIPYENISAHATTAESAAAMFAAKEAFLKAAGTGIGRGIPLDDVAVAHDEWGSPTYALKGTAKEKMEEMGAQSAMLSLTHEAGVAAAVCIIE